MRIDSSSFTIEHLPFSFKSLGFDPIDSVILRVYTPW